MLKRIALFAALALSVVTIASAKTVSFRIYDAATAGNINLKPGKYRVKLKGTQAELMNVDGQKIDANMKVETAKRKYEKTEVCTRQAKNGKREIEWIELSGSKDKLVFD